MDKTTSPRFSFKGWEAGKWFIGNWKTIKELIKVGVPYFCATFITDLALSQFLLTVVGKFVLDCGEYFFKEYS
jgi:hypothetical protein